MAGGGEFCVKCKEVIKNSETVLVCSLWCRKSFHCTCLGLNNSEAHTVACSKLGIKFHCETCEKRLGTELFQKKEPQQSENVEKCINYCVNLLDLVQKLVTLATEVLNQNSAINSKLDVVIRSHAELEYLLQSPKQFIKQSEEACDNSAVSVENDSPNGTTEIRQQYDDTNTSTQNINNKQMTWCASEIQQSDNSVLSTVSGFSEQSADSLHSCQQQNIAEDCSPNECSPSEEFEVISTLREDEEDEERPVTAAAIKRRSSSEDFLGPSTFITENAEDDEAKEAVNDVNFQLQEIKQEMELTDAGSEPESSIPVVMEGRKSNDDGGVDTVSLAARKEKRIRHSTKMDAEAYGNKAGKMYVWNISEDQLEGYLHRHNGLLSCSVCHKTFKTRSNLKQHFRCHTGERPYRCNVCSKAFIYSSNLKEHLLVHTDKSPYKCSVCNKEFRLSLSLKRHMLLHTGECPNRCSFCSKVFSRKSNLKQHVRIHTGERPYRCSFCNQAFTLLSSMHRHLWVHHTVERTYECSSWHSIQKEKSTEVAVTFT